ncbi:hypothetical protein BT69DRAFT_1333221 [Atractiella rhizophila]|nr:hypothetical protein BT69DRAFT_1333221 [Atractiella rhizophila]
MVLGFGLFFSTAPSHLTCRFARLSTSAPHTAKHHSNHNPCSANGAIPLLSFHSQTPSSTHIPILAITLAAQVRPLFASSSTTTLTTLTSPPPPSPPLLSPAWHASSFSNIFVTGDEGQDSGTAEEENGGVEMEMENGCLGDGRKRISRRKGVGMGVAWERAGAAQGS